MSADPVALRSPAMMRLVNVYMRRFMRRNFHALRISKAGHPRLPPDRPAIVYCNHPSWWDPAFIIVLASTCFPGRPAYGPMEQAALERYRFMRRIGLFGIEAGTAQGARAFLRTGAHVLRQPRAMLWVTAEGEFTDPRTRPVRLRPGLAALARRVPEAVCLPLAIEYVFWSERCPEALCRFGDAMDTAVVADCQAALEQQLTIAMEALAAEAVARDPAHFDAILSGQAGIGGVYDTWQRLKALLRGKPFDPAHAGVVRRR